MEGVVRLAHGVVVGRGRKVWASGHRGVPVDAELRELEPGTAVAVGPDAADDETVRASVAELARFVALGGLVAAGAGVDLGHGFRSGRLDGGRGDRRDAVLAALRVLGVRGAARIGDRAGLIVALFGPDVTKPVGAAASTAIRDGRWGALHLASAASDLLGPEQLERVLALTGPGEVESTADGLASVLADHLGQVFGSVSRPRRLTLLLDLWEQVIAHRATLAGLARLSDIRGRQDRSEELGRRYERLVESEIVAQVRSQLGREPTVGEAARWMPNAGQMRAWLSWVLDDALAATALLRVALAVAEDGPAAGLTRCRDLIALAPTLLADGPAGRANRRVPGLIGIPARPGCYLRQIEQRLRDDAAIDPSTVAFVRQRLARAGDYARVVLDAVPDLMYHARVRDAAAVWRCDHLVQWRGVAGFTDVRPPTAWDQPPLANTPTLAQRLRESIGADPEQVETPGDLLWYADLADALAQLHGHGAAAVTHDQRVPEVDHDPEVVDDEPLRPRLDSVALAAAGAAQLVSLGAEVPRRARGWAELTEELLAATTIAEAMTGAFAVPEPLAARDGMTVPGTEVRVELARDPTKLAEWARYMGNCIAGPYYLGAARDGECVLVALREPDGRIVANVELVPVRGGWHIDEFKARFNTDPPADLAKRVRAWVAALPVARKPAASPSRPRPRGRPRHHHRGNLLREVGQPLGELAAGALATREVTRALAVIGGVETLTGLTALRRASGRRLEEIVRQRLAGDGVDLVALWRAAGVRPLAMALDGLDPAVRQRYAHLEMLAHDGALPAAPRRLARLPEVADARTVDLVGQRTRAAIGRLARTDDPALAPAVARQADTDLLCALVLAVSTAAEVGPAALTPVTAAGRVGVPGFPRSRLDDPDGPWQRARPVVAELGGDPEWTPSRTALVVPTAWLGPGGWRALWARAARTARASSTGRRHAPPR
jgi:hypothetical protein